MIISLAKITQKIWVRQQQEIINQMLAILPPDSVVSFPTEKILRNQWLRSYNQYYYLIPAGLNMASLRKLFFCEGIDILSGENCGYTIEVIPTTTRLICGDTSRAKVWCQPCQSLLLSIEETLVWVWMARISKQDLSDVQGKSLICRNRPTSLVRRKTQSKVDHYSVVYLKTDCRWLTISPLWVDRGYIKIGSDVYIPQITT